MYGEVGEKRGINMRKNTIQKFLKKIDKKDQKIIEKTKKTKKFIKIFVFMYPMG